MSLKTQIDSDLKQAMRDKDDVAKLTLRAVKTAITEAEKSNTQDALADKDIEQIVQREAKGGAMRPRNMKKRISQRVDEELAELAILERYLPKQLSADEVEEIVRATIADVGATSMADMGKVMGAVMPKVAGVADGNAVNQAVRKVLGAA